MNLVDKLQRPLVSAFHCRTGNVFSRAGSWGTQFGFWNWSSVSWTETAMGSRWIKHFHMMLECTQMYAGVKWLVERDNGNTSFPLCVSLWYPCDLGPEAFHGLFVWGPWHQRPLSSNPLPKWRRFPLDPFQIQNVDTSFASPLSETPDSGVAFLSFFSPWKSPMGLCFFF